jgi:hypothetical protein
MGTQVGRGTWDLPVKIIYVVDASALDDQVLDYRKCEYVAIGTASEAGRLRRLAWWARELAWPLLAAIRGRP